MKLTLHAGDGDKKPVIEESPKEPVKTIAQGRPDRSGEPVVTNSYAFYFCIRGCGCIGHPAFPAPSDQEERVLLAKTRAISAAGTMIRGWFEVQGISGLGRGLRRVMGLRSLGRWC